MLQHVMILNNSMLSTLWQKFVFVHFLSYYDSVTVHIELVVEKLN